MDQRKSYCAPMARLLPVLEESALLQGSIEPADPIDGHWEWED